VNRIQLVTTGRFVACGNDLEEVAGETMNSMRPVATRLPVWMPVHRRSTTGPNVLGTQRALPPGVSPASFAKKNCPNPSLK
jgi:hypothetical protein